ncbi:hypothetical protein NQ117_00285 [Paenibacillus sp. SC116]|nr:hypothetical protein [Paenibacillus sp. SC116]MCR8842111.1 hypothetical protein [Paenibacillus sp. SC116]
MALDPQVQVFMEQGGNLNTLTAKEHGEAKPVSKVEDFLSL